MSQQLNRRSYSAEFKADAVRLGESSGRSRADIASELGIRAELLRRWALSLDKRGISSDSSMISNAFIGSDSCPGLPPNAGPRGLTFRPIEKRHYKRCFFFSSYSSAILFI